MRNSKRNKRNYIIIGLCSILLIMAVGFAAFSQQLQINSTSEVTGDWCLGFDNTKTNTLVATPGIQTGTAPTGSMTYEGSTCGEKSQTGVTLASTFKQPGDSIEYTLTILNEGSLDAAINSVLVDNTSVTSDQTITKGNIKYKIEMPLVTSVAAGESTTMKVTASFQNDVDITKSFGGDSASIEVKVNAEQDDGSGGFEVTGRPYTGTIYRNSAMHVSIGDSIAPGGSSMLCAVGIINGYTYNSCEDDDWYFNSQSECESDLADGISNGLFQPGDLTCQNGTISYTKLQSEIQSQYDYYLKHTVVNDIITENYACFVINNTEYCMKGSTDGSTFEANKNLLGGLRDAGTITCDYFDNSYVSCGNNTIRSLHIYSSGGATSGLSAGYHCEVASSGNSSCNVTGEG